MFDWLADVGGLIRAVLSIGQVIMYPFTAYELQSILLWMLVRIVPSIHQNRQINKADRREEDFLEKYGEKSDDPKRKKLLNVFLQDQN